MVDYPSNLTVRPLAPWVGARTARPVISPFTATESSTKTLLRKELAAVGATDVVLQIDLRESQFRLDGRPRAGVMPDSQAIVLSFTSRGQALSFPCDSFTHWIDNLRAIVLTMEKLRAIDRYGVTKSGEQYSGWRQIESSTPSDHYTDEDQALGDLFDEIPARQFRVSATPSELVRLAKRSAHPDHGGTTERFQKVIDAEAYLREQGLL